MVHVSVELRHHNFSEDGMGKVDNERKRGDRERVIDREREHERLTENERMIKTERERERVTHKRRREIEKEKDSKKSEYLIYFFLKSISINNKTKECLKMLQNQLLIKQHKSNREREIVRGIRESEE